MLNTFIFLFYMTHIYCSLKPAGKAFLIFCISILNLVACTNNSNNKKSEEFIIPVKKYADALIENGRDEYGKMSSPLFASALNRNTLKLAENGEIGEIDGVRVRDRSLAGANMIHDIDLFKL